MRVRGPYPRKILLEWRSKVNQRNATDFPARIPFELELVVAEFLGADFEPDKILVVERNKLNGSDVRNTRLAVRIRKRYNRYI